MFIDTFIFDVADDAGYYLDGEVGTADALSVDVMDVGHCTVEKLYIENGTDEIASSWDGSFPSEWGWKTIMQAEYNDNLQAGSVDYSVELVSEIRLKRRKKGDLRWKTIYVKTTDTVDDFRFTYQDYLAAGNTEYEYMLVPIIVGEEGAAQIKTIKSEFRDFYLMDKNQTFHIVLDAANSFQYNIEGSAQTTISRKYPFIIRNGSVGYYSGTVNATFLELIECDWDVENGATFRRTVDEFLANNNVKILKDWMGNIWMVSVFDVISQDSGDSPYLPVHSFNWTECGDAEDIGDLYDNGFINTELDRE